MIEFKCKNISAMNKMHLKVGRIKSTLILKLYLKGGTSNEVWREFI